MPARIRSNVLFPLPFGPTMPKNSPASTENETSLSASFRSYVVRRNGCRKYSLKYCRCSCGIRNDFETPLTSIAGPNSDPFGEVPALAPEEREPDREDDA